MADTEDLSEETIEEFAAKMIALQDAGVQIALKPTGFWWMGLWWADGAPWTEAHEVAIMALPREHPFRLAREEAQGIA